MVITHSVQNQKFKEKYKTGAEQTWTSNKILEAGSGATVTPAAWSLSQLE